VFEVAENCQRVHLDNVQLKNCAIRTPRGKVCIAAVHLETSDFNATPIDLHLSKGKVTLLNCRVVAPVRIFATTPTDKKRSVYVLLNTTNLDRGVEVSRVKELVVRACSVLGDKVEFKDCDKLTFDANVCKAPTILFSQPKSGAFKKTKIQKSDFLNSRLVLKSPRDGSKKDQISCDKCFFGGSTKKKDILRLRVTDGHIDETSGAYLWLKKINKRALNLGGRKLNVPRAKSK
jgi:hypothetical protein